MIRGVLISFVSVMLYLANGILPVAIFVGSYLMFTLTMLTFVQNSNLSKKVITVAKNSSI